MTTTAILDATRAVLENAPRPVLLHGPDLRGRAGEYVKECIDTAWVSSAGAYVDRFERELAATTGTKRAVAVVNGTAALHIALKLVGVEAGDEVLIPSLTFVATANAVSYCGGTPHFVDVEPATLGLDPASLGQRLAVIGEKDNGRLVNRETGRRLAAVVPMHTLGHPVDLAGLMKISEHWGLPIVEDAAESLGSYYHDQHTGTFGRLGILSFNGNKIVTTGGGGAILTDDDELADRAKHLTTTAKVPHRWEFIHDETGYNYRMPNINAALGCGQLERLEEMVALKRRLADTYRSALADVGGVRFIQEPVGCHSNYWLNAVELDEELAGDRDAILSALDEDGIQVRPIWRPMHQLPMYKSCPRADLPMTERLARRVINLPSSASLAG
jgi:perosamine synthetase